MSRMFESKLFGRWETLLVTARIVETLSWELVLCDHSLLSWATAVSSVCLETQLGLSATSVVGRRPSQIGRLYVSIFWPLFYCQNC